MLSREALDELAQLHSRGKLTPSNVVAHASEPSSALHHHFDWNDATAARQHRLDQAGRLITKARVRILPREVSEPRRVRAKVEGAERPTPLRVSVPSDRKLLGDEERRQVTADARERVDPIAGYALVKDAVRELVLLRRRYAHLVELRDVFVAVDAIAQRVLEAERGGLTAAVRQARELVDREGLDVHTASERAARACEVPLHVVLEAVRIRRAV